MIHTELKLINVMDENYAQGGYIRTSDIRSETVTATVDTGSMYVVITEELYKKLGLSPMDKRIAKCANGQRVSCILTSPVHIKWKERAVILQTLVVPGAEKVLFGALALEGMDLMVNPVAQELVGVHGDKEEIYALKAS
ncbi:MAG: aspartyl protease family protein [Treponema sp.]|nr:aspartyl protease family protein [Treponema sp.]